MFKRISISNCSCGYLPTDLPQDDNTNNCGNGSGKSLDVQKSELIEPSLQKKQHSKETCIPSPASTDSDLTELPSLAKLMTVSSTIHPTVCQTDIKAQINTGDTDTPTSNIDNVCAKTGSEVVAESSLDSGEVIQQRKKPGRPKKKRRTVVTEPAKMKQKLSLPKQWSSIQDLAVGSNSRFVPKSVERRQQNLKKETGKSREKDLSVVLRPRSLVAAAHQETDSAGVEASSSSLESLDILRQPALPTEDEFHNSEFSNGEMSSCSPKTIVKKRSIRKKRKAGKVAISTTSERAQPIAEAVPEPDKQSDRRNKQRSKNKKQENRCSVSYTLSTNSSAAEKTTKTNEEDSPPNIFRRLTRSTSRDSSPGSVTNDASLEPGMTVNFFTRRYTRSGSPIGSEFDRDSSESKTSSPSRFSPRLVKPMMTVQLSEDLGSSPSRKGRQSKGVTAAGTSREHQPALMLKVSKSAVTVKDVQQGKARLDQKLNTRGQAKGEDKTASQQVGFAEFDPLQSDTAAEVQLKRKRGRPRKLPQNSPVVTTETGMASSSPALPPGGRRSDRSTGSSPMSKRRKRDSTETTNSGLQCQAVGENLERGRSQDCSTVPLRLRSKPSGTGSGIIEVPSSRGRTRRGLALLTPEKTLSPANPSERPSVFNSLRKKFTTIYSSLKH